MKQLAPAAALALLLAACSPEAPPPADAPATTGAGAPAPTALGEALLEADGFMPANPGGRGTGRKLSFGEDEAVVVDFITRLRGDQPPRRSSNAECPAGPLAFADWGDNFQLAFSEGKFAGWTAGEGAPRGFSTVSGVHIGSTLAQLRAAHPEVEVREDSLGPEFSAGEIHGTLSGTGDDATVTTIWAGVNCVFR
ncbi:MAG: hypothetical protein U1E18_02240 [Brevundimonas sp.]|uniref:hypothetical protein n=1 Tax=Brevundimonas sp. TaxID=1871086 RepID=UPI002AB85BA8|nr:hypothetical protein [Brevundimonas sp.]MDZ4108402.1 hypothetical protein [Brevundimonas sp.]